MSGTEPQLPSVADLEAEAALDAKLSPQIALESTAVAPKALAGWNVLQEAVSGTLAERLRQTQAHRSNAWKNLSRV